MTSEVQPLPALPIYADHRYGTVFTVAAGDETQAIDAAKAMLPPYLSLIGVQGVHRVTGVLWRVSLKVAEDA